MGGNWIWIGVFASIGLGSLAMAIGVWLPKNKGIFDWLMGAGATILTIGVGGMLAMMYIPRASELIGGEAMGIVLYTSVGGGLLLFGMGFLADRIRQRGLDQYKEQIQPGLPEDPR